MSKSTQLHAQRQEKQWKIIIYHMKILHLCLCTGVVPMGIDGNAEDLPPPYWALDVTCGKGTHISYGPWADRQR